jgi:hypothetical protein
MPQLIDAATLDSAKTRTGFDGQDYVLIFSDESEVDGCTFFQGDDPYWEASGTRPPPSRSGMTRSR